MKAIRVHEFGGPEQLRFEAVPDPHPDRDQLVVELRAIGVNPVDTYIRTGTHARKPERPYIPGGDGAGIVLEVGAAVRRYAVGDRVYVEGDSSGTYAERVLCRESQLHPLPPAISFAQGAAMGVPYGTAYRALFQIAGAKRGETVLVHGASGGVGLATVQLAHAAGLTVFGTAGTDAGRALVRAQGADAVFAHGEADLSRQVQERTAGRGVDLILEMLANRNLAEDLRLLAHRGRVVVVGNRGTIDIKPRDLMSRDATIHGMMLFNATEEERASIHAALVAGLEDGTLRPVIGREFALAEAARAHSAILEAGAHGKMILVP
jgi:NADPH2:quinone reductase